MRLSVFDGLYRSAINAKSAAIVSAHPMLPPAALAQSQGEQPLAAAARATC
jgi:hypothetical protein